MGAWLDATGNEYRHTFIARGTLALAAALAFVMVHRHFQRLGGAGGGIGRRSEGKLCAGPVCSKPLRS